MARHALSAGLVLLAIPGTALSIVDWTQLGATFTVVAPLYAVVFVMQYRMGKLQGTPSNVDDNEDDIGDIRQEMEAQGRMMAEIADMMEKNRAALKEHRDRLEELHDDHVTFEEHIPREE